MLRGPLIELKSERYRIVEIKKKTTAKMFGNIKLGDVLTFSTNLNGGSYQNKTLTATLERTNESIEKTFVEISNNLKPFVLEIATETNKIEFGMEK